MADLKVGKLSLDLNKVAQNKNFGNSAIAALIILIILDIYFVLMPEFKILKKMKIEAEKAQQKITLGKRELGDLPKFQSQLESMEKQISQKEAEFTTADSMAIMIEEISKTASESGVKISQINPVRDITPSKKGQKDPFIKVPILIQAESDYHSLGKFINNLEKENKIFILKELTLVVDSLEYKNSSVSLNIATILKAEE